MSGQCIRPAFSAWPVLNQRLIERVANLSSEELALSAGPDRWPLWAVVGHAACQRVFWLCDFAGEPGVETTPFPNAAWNCPGDDDLEHVLSSSELVDALLSTFAIVERTIATWSVAELEEVLEQPDWGDDWRHTRGSVIQRVHAHDLWHAAEVNEILTKHGHTGIDVWS